MLILLIALTVQATLAIVLTTNTSHCSFAVNDLQFDLCPLFHGRTTTFNVVIDEETPPTRTSNSYAINLSKPLERDGTLTRELQCAEGTQICLTVINTRPNHPGEPTRILQVIPIAKAGLQPTARIAEDLKDTPLQLTFHGGVYKDHTQNAVFFFYCDRDTKHPSIPTFMWAVNGTHAFSWKTKYGCQPPKNKNPEPPSGEHTGKSSLLHVFWKLLSIICLAIFFLSRRRHYLFLATSVISRHHRLRSRFPFLRPPQDSESSGATIEDDIPLTPCTTGELNTTSRISGKGYAPAVPHSNYGSL